MNTEIVIALIGFVSTFVTGMITYFVTKTSSFKEYMDERGRAVDDGFKTLMAVHKQEIERLRTDLNRLTEENTLLREEIHSLKQQLLDLTYR